MRTDPSTHIKIEVPKPDRVRCLKNIPFGWLDARLLLNRWLDLLSPEALASYTFLCLAGDRQGVSYYRKDRIGFVLGIDEDKLTSAFDRLYELDLVAFKPFHEHALEGFRQVLSLPPQRAPSPEELLLGVDDNER